MAKTTLVSPIHSLTDQFSLSRDIELNKFHLLGSAPQGMVHIVILQKHAVDMELLTLYDTGIQPSPFCKIWLINTHGDIPIGVLVEAKKEKTTFGPYNVYVGTIEPKGTPFIPISITDKLGMLCFTSERSTMFVTADITKAPFVVLDDRNA